MPDIDFHRIAARGGSQASAFEGLCCQLARRESAGARAFVRLRGAGGDGGVECYALDNLGQKHGWQAKYVFSIEALLRQLSRSLATALEVHPDLMRYTVCCPFDFTGPTGRRGRSQTERFDEWAQQRKDEAKASGRELEIVRWAASDIEGRILGFDASGGFRRFFFDETLLTPEWFDQHLSAAAEAVRPRYTPELTVETPVSDWFDALGRTARWAKQLHEEVRAVTACSRQVAQALERQANQAGLPAWPAELREQGRQCVQELDSCLGVAGNLSDPGACAASATVNAGLEEALRRIEHLDAELADIVEREHGEGTSRSPGFRQFAAEYMCSFPTAHLDGLRELREATEHFAEWIRGPEGGLAFESAFVLTGRAGVGKTHTICDVARHRLSEGRLSIVLFGTQFAGGGAPWSEVHGSLGLPGDIGREGLLDLLEAAAEESGHLLIIFIDALNETRPLRYWRERLADFVAYVGTRPHLRICASCRSSFLDHCLPGSFHAPRFEHQGFAEMQHEACRRFFDHYGLEPPVTPVLQPELANPLYLRLVCQAMQAKGLNRLPPGWRGLVTAIAAFLEEKEKQFSWDHETTASANVVANSLSAIAQKLVEAGLSAIAWSDARRVVAGVTGDSAARTMLDWLLREDLLIEDAPRQSDPLTEETTLRLAFERLGDHLVSHALLTAVADDPIEKHLQPDGCLFPYLGDLPSVRRNAGIVAALSVQFPERYQSRRELPSLLPAGAVQEEVVRIAVDSLRWRDPTLMTQGTIELLREALALPGFSAYAFDAILCTAWAPSPVDAFWVHELLSGQSLADRDSFWCGYLHDRFENSGPVDRLLESAFELSLEQVPTDMAERWAMLLLWFCAAADRRVRDKATRALVRVTTPHPTLWPSLLERMLQVDDDYITERALLAAYGVAILTRDATAAHDTAAVVYRVVFSHVEAFQNALVRDLARSIVELADHLGVRPTEIEIEDCLPPHTSDWPLRLPNSTDIEAWKSLPRLVRSCLEDDFYIYTLSCLHRYSHAFPRADMAKWILRHVAEDIGYAGSGSEEYDKFMLGRYGGGRSRRTWAERIGKKYQWIGMYRLAARLADHVPPELDSWEPGPLKTPLLLDEERQLDPTLPSPMSERQEECCAWWIASGCDFQLHRGESDQAWVEAIDDLPSLGSLLGPIVREDTRWIVLEAYPTWTNLPPDGDRSKPYRHVWLQVRGYLVPAHAFREGMAYLDGQDFFGLWMPEGRTSLFGFLGEYPWATPYNVEPESYYGRRGRGEIPIEMTPVANQLRVEWTFDATLPRPFHMNVPARKLFEPGDLWSDGQGGFSTKRGSTVYTDPSVVENGPSALVGDIEDVLDRLERLGLRLLWTALGGKDIIVHDPQASVPGRTFSQAAGLNSDGTVAISQIGLFKRH